MKTLIFALLFIAIIIAVSFASPVLVSNVKSQTQYGTLTYMYYETSAGPGSSTPSTNTAPTPSGSSGSYSLARASTAYLWSPQFGSATTINAGNWVLGVWATSTSFIVSYIPITITNSQSSATPSTFQEMITWNPSSYTSYEASNLGNIRFYSDSAFTAPLYAWLESCTPSLSNSATSATAWVKLTSSIAASGGTLTIYMAFLSTATNFDGSYWGDAPNLSGTYGAYDNGVNVFNAYFNGNTATSSFSVYSGDTLSQATGVSGPGGTTINAIKVTGTTGAHVPAFSFNKAMSNGALIVESSFSLAGDTADATGAVGLADNAAVTSIGNGITAQMGYASSYFSQAYEVGGTATLDVNGAGTSNTNWEYASVTYTGSAASSWSAYIAPQLYSTTGGYSGTVSNNPLSSATNLYIGQISGSLAINVNYNFMRARAYPPNNVMPSISFGSLSLAVNSIQVSIYVTNSAGTIQSTVASNVQSPTIGSSATQYMMSFAGSQVAVPQNGYITIMFSATQIASYTIYWGQGQPTNFQVPYRVLTT
ncbi:MAG: hypothetical protein ABSF44_11620 [Candidatus Bathyarchaeia archaeon]